MNTRPLLFTLLLSGTLAPALPAARAEEPAEESGAALPPENRQITQAYDKAFELYLGGNYQEAIAQWNRILRLDPGQVTAKNMIVEARQKLAGASAGQKGRFYALVAQGRYREALLKMETLTAMDPSNPALAMLSSRLKRVVGIAERRPSNSKAWNVASLGVYHYVNEEENLPFSYDAFRYAAELSPKEPRFVRLAAMLEEEFPQLKLNDTKPPQVSVLEHKKELGLRYIYDSKFYMAVRELESALKLDPEDTTTLKRLGSAYLQLKDYQKAREAWDKAIRIAPGDEQLKGYLEALNAMPEAAAAPKKKQRRSRRAPPPPAQ